MLILEVFFISKKTIGNCFQWNVYTHFQKIYSWIRHEHSEILWEIALVVLLRFGFKIIASKMSDFKDFLPLKISLVSTISETHALTFRKYIAEKSKSNPKQRKTYELLWLHSSLFALEFLSSGMLVDHIILPAK